MMLTLSPLEVGFLFAMHDRPSPPEADGALEAISFIRRKRTLAAIEGALSARGILVPSAGGELGMSPEAAEVLGVCLAADYQLHCTADGSSVLTAYFSGDHCAVLRQGGDSIEIFLEGGDDAATWIELCLGTLGAGRAAPCELFQVATTSLQLEALMAAAMAGDERVVERVCATNGWAMEMITPAVSALAQKGPLLSTTALTVGEDGVAVSRIVPCKSGAYALVFEAPGKDEASWFGCYSPTDLAEIVRGTHRREESLNG